MSHQRNAPALKTQYIGLAGKAGLSALVVLMIFTTDSALAGDAGKASRFGAEVKGFQAKALGVLYGWRFSAFESDSFSMGGAGFTGQLSKDAGTFSYGGLLGTYSAHLGRKLDLDLSLIAGGGGGTVSGDITGGGVMVEPGVGLNIILGQSVRAVLGGGYIWTPSTADFSGATFGIRFDFLLYGGINAPQVQGTDAPTPGQSVPAPRAGVAPQQAVPMVGAAQQSGAVLASPIVSNAPLQQGVTAVPPTAPAIRQPASIPVQQAAPRPVQQQQPQQARPAGGFAPVRR